MSTQIAPPSPSGKLASEQVILSSPMSYSGATARLRRRFKSLMARIPRPRADIHPAARIALLVLRYAAIAAACLYTVGALFSIYAAVTVWYVFAYGLFSIPTVIWRLFRRGQRRDKRQALQHREMMAAIESTRR